MRRHEGSDSATAIRGIAAISVFVIHGGGLGLRNIFEAESFESGVINRFVDLGATGPFTFFIVSGFSLASSLSSHRRSFVELVITRALRLLPLFWVVLTLAYVGNGVFSNLENLSGEKATDIFTRYFLLSSFTKTGISGDPIGILWTIPQEFWWTLLIPLFLWICTRRAPWIPLLFTFTSLLFLEQLAPKIMLTAGFDEASSYKSILSAGLYFYLGVIAYKLTDFVSETKSMNSFVNSTPAISAQSFALLIAGVWLLILFLGFNRIEAGIAGPLSAFCILVWATTQEKMKRLRLPGWTIYIGTICYGIYLWHMIVLGLVNYFFETTKLLYSNGSETLASEIAVGSISFLLILVISSLTYFFVELPFIKLSKKVRRGKR